MFLKYKKYCRHLFSCDSSALEDVAWVCAWVVIFFIGVLAWWEILSASLSFSELVSVILYPLPFYAPHFILAVMFDESDE